MKRTPITIDPQDFPAPFRPLLVGSPVWDSSSSTAARVWFIDREGGLFLKRAARGTLKREAELTAFFHKKGLSSQVLAYESLEDDWLLTVRLPGEDCVHPMYLSEPERLCDTTAQLLRMLHDTDPTGCPVARTPEYLAQVHRNHETGKCHPGLFPAGWSFPSAEDAWREVEENGKYLQTEALLHGDYCLPNILLDDWRFSGFIDLDTGGLGDRHVDLFWGVWSLNRNLGTNRYFDRFLDAYGRDLVDPEKLRTIAAVEIFL